MLWGQSVATAVFSVIRLHAWGNEGMIGRLKISGIPGCLVWLTVLMGSAVVSAEESDRPNVLFLFADDQRADALGAWGNPVIRTPHLDQLIERGYGFRNNYCYGSNSGAVCIPSRVMVHTGKRWHDSDQQMTGQVTLGEHLRKADYDTFATGKWHNGKPSLLRSFAAGKNIFMGGMCDHTKVPISEIVAGELESRGIGEKFSSELFADAAIEFLEGRQSDKPFFAYVAFTAPHDPRNPPLEYREAYYASHPSLPINFLPQHPFNNGSLLIRDEMLAPWPRPADMIQRQLCEYYGLITHMDEQIGRILAALQKSPGGENTIIVYAADHGLAMGSHGLLGKQSLYEHSMKCPLVFVGPGIPAQQETSAFSYLYDIFPTLCGLLQIAPPPDLGGHDLSPIWRGEQSSVRETIFLPYMKSQRAIRSGDWKLIVYPDTNYVQLFNLQQDPHELTNLAGKPEHAEKQAALWELMTTAQQEVGDELALTTEDPQPLTIDLTNHARRPDPHQPEWILRDYFDEERKPKPGSQNRATENR